jgi:hypothetical protein
MIEKKIVKTVRFKEDEIEKINFFLAENPSIDFSTLIRLAVGRFIKSPSLNSVNKNKIKMHEKESEAKLWN